MVSTTPMNTSEGRTGLTEKSSRLAFQKERHTTNLRSNVDVTFDVKGSAKPTQATVDFIRQLFDKIKSYNPLILVLNYKDQVKKCEQGVIACTKLAMKEVPTFIKFLTDCFWEIIIKRHERGREQAKIIFIHHLDLDDFIETIKEDTSEVKTFMKK